jgi:hypothetical protein
MVVRMLKRQVLALRSELSFGSLVPRGMQRVSTLNHATIERLAKQIEFLLKTYEEDLANDPRSRATGLSRSNLIAVEHTIEEVYRAPVARDSANVLDISTSLGKDLGEMQTIIKKRNLSVILPHEHRAKEGSGKRDSAKMKNLLSKLCRAIEIERLENISPWGLDNPHPRQRWIVGIPS